MAGDHCGRWPCPIQPNLDAASLGRHPGELLCNQVSVCLLYMLGGGPERVIIIYQPIPVLRLDRNVFNESLQFLVHHRALERLSTEPRFGLADARLQILGGRRHTTRCVPDQKHYQCGCHFGHWKHIS